MDCNDSCPHYRPCLASVIRLGPFARPDCNRPDKPPSRAVRAVLDTLQAGPMTTHEIAARMGVTTRTIEQRIHQAKAHGLVRVVGKARRHDGHGTVTVYGV